MKETRMNCTATLDETFADFLLSRRAKGLAEKTLESYSSQWKAVARHLDTGTDIVTLQKADLDGGVVFYRHTKNRKAQVIPLCSPMIAILREYGRYRGGGAYGLSLLHGNGYTTDGERLAAVYRKVQHAARGAKDFYSPVPPHISAKTSD